MKKYLISFMKWLLAVVLVAVPFIAGIGCKENGAHAFWQVTGWLCMAEAVAAAVCAVVLERPSAIRRREEEAE